MSMTEIVLAFFSFWKIKGQESSVKTMFISIKMVDFRIHCLRLGDSAIQQPGDFLFPEDIGYGDTGKPDGRDDPLDHDLRSTSCGDGRSELCG